jgi:hypothetical protein
MPQVGEVYNDNAIQYGSRNEILKRGQTTPVLVGAGSGLFYVENISIQRPVQLTEQPNQIGGPNGFVMVNKQEKGSCLVQCGPAANKRPLNGDWFEDTLDPQIGTERFVLHDVSNPYEYNGIWKVNATLIKANFPSVAAP